MASPEFEALVNLAAQLAVSQESTTPSAAKLLASEDEEDCDFSSFPSLSLEESPGNYHTGIFCSRGDVESHVESLLSRPILLGKQEDDVKSVSGLVDTESDSLDEFFVESLEEVPKQMLSNFCNSFSTLMNSRLRAYSTFLARHGLSLARCSKTNQELEGVVGIEHKLETMLGIGSEVSVRPKSSDLTIARDTLPKELQRGEDEEAYQLTLPLKMRITVDIALPHVKEVGGNEHMEISLQTTGKICGIFANASKDPQSSSILRVAEVSLNMHELLTAMAEQASKVISCIVEMTNAAYTVPLPSVTDESKHPVAPSRKHRKRKVEFADEDSFVSLSPEKCANIVDCVIGELDDTLLIPPAAKKLKVLRDPPPTILN